MNRRTLLEKAGLFSLSFSFAGCANTQARNTTSRPNIVLILSDDMGYSDIGCYGREIKPMEGQSLVPAFRGRKIQRKEPIFWEHEGNWAIRDGKWKLVCDGPGGPWELYDLQADRTQLNNLAEKNPEKVAELAGKWHAWAKRANVLPWPYKPQWNTANKEL